MRHKTKEAFLKNRGKKGIALVWSAIMLITLLLFTGISIDVARIYLTANQLQNAADAAALAGAQVVKAGNDPNTRDRTYNLAHANYYVGGSSVVLDKNQSNAADGDIVLGLYFPQRTNPATRFEPTTIEGEFANAVKVVPKCITGQANPPVSLIFGPIAHIPTANVTRYAIAMSSGGTGAGLIALDCGSPGLLLDGGVQVDVNNGAVQVNCNQDPALRANGGSGFVNADEIDVCGEVWKDDFPSEIPVLTGAEPIPDPLGCNEGGICLPPPPNGPLGKLDGVQITSGTVSINNGPHVLDPGYYPEGIAITGGDITFKPGIYVFGGSGGIKITGSPTICAKRVMFYAKQGPVEITGTGQMTITELVPWTEEPGVTPDDAFCSPPNPTDPPFTYPLDLTTATLATYEGMVIYQARDNHTDAKLAGTSNFVLEGTIYFPENHLDLGGTNFTAGTQLIASTMRIHGNGTITVNYDGRNRAPGGRSFLVQ